jgi:predicted nucleotidyltransferase
MKLTTATPAHPTVSMRRLTDAPDVTHDLLLEMTRRIVEACDPEMVVLFGSYADGEPHVGSDVDLFVVRKPADEQETNHSRIMNVRAAAKIPFLPLDVIVRTPEEVELRLKIGDFFIKDIVDRGRVLYRRDAA